MKETATKAETLTDLSGTMSTIELTQILETGGVK
jgi:hypothetical protein